MQLYLRKRTGLFRGFDVCELRTCGSRTDGSFHCTRLFSKRLPHHGHHVGDLIIAKFFQFPIFKNYLDLHLSKLEIIMNLLG